MINLITGLPGNSKTLFALRFLIDWAKRENRAVYYSGLKEFIVDDPRLEGTTWIEFDPVKWHEVVPSGAIIFIDEAQKVFRARSLGTVPGPHVTELEEHRHKGLDFVLLTQHPSLIDPAIRKLTQTHRHMVRIFGFEVSTVHFWQGVKEKPESAGAKKESEKTKWAFDKTLYGLYKSADLHTMKKSIPFRLKLMIGLAPVLVAAVAVAVYQVKKASPAEPAKVATVVKASPVGGLPGVVGNTNTNTNTMPSKRPADPVEDLKDWQWKETPRVAQLPQTAPKYDALTVPTRVPIPAMCIQIGSVHDRGEVRCKCYSQQATPMPVEFNMCMEFARNGFFRDFDADKDRAASERTQASVAVLSNRQDAAVPVRQVQQAGPNLVIPGEPMGPQRTDKSAPMSANIRDDVIQDGPPNNRATRAAMGAGV